MRRVMLLALLSLALPTAALANTIFYFTGQPLSWGFNCSGVIGDSCGIFVQGTLDTITIFTPDLLAGGFFNTGTVTVQNPAGATVFENSLNAGQVFTDLYPQIVATLEPSVTVISGTTNVVFPSAFGDAEGSVSANTVPEPDTLELLEFGLLGLGVIGFARMARQQNLRDGRTASTETAG